MAKIKLKQIAYLSTFSLDAADMRFSAEMINILNASRQYNTAHDITGVIFVAGNFVLQILEGDSAELGALMYKITRDKRHHDVSIVLNRMVQARAFANWSMRFISEATELHERLLQRINAEFKCHFKVTNEMDRTRLAKMLKAANVAPDNARQAPSERTSFDRQMLSMSAWPRPNQLRLTSDVIYLCTNLVGKEQSYESLKSEPMFSSNEHLNSRLTAIEGLGLLRRKHLAMEPGVSHVVANRGLDRFSSVLRKFIAGAKVQ